MKRTIELYGLLKEVSGPSVALELPEKATAGDVMTALKTLFKDKAGLLDGCALAGEDAVLSSTDTLPDGRLAALPPVCGG